MLSTFFLYFVAIAFLIRTGALPQVSNVAAWMLPPGLESVRPEIYMLKLTVFKKITTALFFLVSSFGTDQPPRVVPLIVLVCDAYLSLAVVPRGSTLPRGAGWRPVLADVALASCAA